MQNSTNDHSVDSAALSRKALQHFKEGRLQQAKDVCQRILQQKKHPGALLILGWIAHQQREFEVAVERYQQYLTIRPEDAEARYTLGLVLSELGRTEDAIEQFKKSITITADNAAVHRQLGDTYTRLRRLEEAIKPYQQAIALQADDVVTIINLGNAFHGLHRHTQSIPLYEQALAMQPDNVQVHRHLGASYQNSGQTDKAIKCFEQALSLQPNYFDARIKLAQVLRELGRAEEALVHIEQVIALKPDETQAHIILAETLRELGQTDLAVECLEQHLKAQPACGALYYHIAAMKPKKELIPVVKKLISDTGLPKSDAIHCHFALGNIYRDGKSFDQAFSHFLKANTLYRETFSYETKKNTQIIDGLIKVYSKGSTQAKCHLGSASKLPVFILGMPRSGSTLVEQILSSHSQVHGTGELHALTTAEGGIIQQLEYAKPYPECMPLIDKNMAGEFSAQYLQELALHCPTAKRITDKLLGNFSRIGLIKTLFPHASIIHCQRNSLDNCISIFFHFFPELKCSFKLSELGQYYLDYQRLMSHWQELFPGEILNVQYEELVMDQERVSRQLIDYIGLEWDEKCLDFYNSERDVRTSSNIQVRQPMYKKSINRWKHYEKHLQPLIEVLQQAH